MLQTDLIFSPFVNEKLAVDIVHFMEESGWGDIKYLLHARRYAST
jgi:hypothetical protein